MPLFAEIGPLKLDPQLQTEVDEACEKILQYSDRDLLELAN